MNILKHIYIVEKYIVEHLKTFRVVLKFLECIVVLHTFLCGGGKLSYNLGGIFAELLDRSAKSIVQRGLFCLSTSGNYTQVEILTGNS